MEDTLKRLTKAWKSFLGGIFSGNLNILNNYNMRNRLDLGITLECMIRTCR